MIVTLHADNPGLLARACYAMQQHGWKCYAEGAWEFFPLVAVSVGAHITADAERDYRYHETISIPKGEER